MNSKKRAAQTNRWVGRAIGAVCCALLAFTPIVASAEDTCGCNGNPRFPEAAAVLETLGYAQDEYTVLLTWNEMARDGSGILITGLHVRPPEGDPFDLYVDENFSLLDAKTLAELGLAAKNWDLRPVEVHASVAQGSTKSLVPAYVPEGVSMGIIAQDAVELPPLDMAVIEAEDLKAKAKKFTPTRIGAFQDFPEPIEVIGENATDGTWQTGTNGERIWTLSIQASDARGIRVHFSMLALPAGTELAIYNTLNTSEAYGPYAAPPLGQEDLWSASCFTTDVTVECSVPSDVDISGLHIAIDRIVNIYQDFAKLQWAKIGSCHLDVSCYADWATEATSVAGIGTIGSDGFLWCTGTLIEDLIESTSSPLFLTANHCVGSEAEAATTEFYWLYQTDICNGPAPDPIAMPRTSGGAFYLAGMAADPYGGSTFDPATLTGNDFALLRLREYPPGTVAFAGWTTDMPSLGDATVGIHHPAGSYKRISFGEITQSQTGANAQAYDLYHEIMWTNGAVEPGSSGSPIMTADSHQIIGQLLGGTGDCDTPGGWVFYGRFDVTYPLIEDILGTPPPPPPTGVEASDGDHFWSVRVRWDASLSVSEFQVWRNSQDDPDTAIPISPWVQDNTYVDRSAEYPTKADDAALQCPATTPRRGPSYFYFVRSRNNSGSSSLSLSDEGYAGESSAKADAAGFSPWGSRGDLIVLLLVPLALLALRRLRSRRI